MEAIKTGTKIESKMVNVLTKKMSSDSDFLLAITTFLETDEERQAMIDEIYEGNVKSPSDALLFAVQLDNQR